MRPGSIPSSICSSQRGSVNKNRPNLFQLVLDELPDVVHAFREARWVSSEELWIEAVDVKPSDKHRAQHRHISSETPTSWASTCPCSPSPASEKSNTKTGSELCSCAAAPFLMVCRAGEAMAVLEPWETGNAPQGPRPALLLKAVTSTWQNVGRARCRAQLLLQLWSNV